MSTASALAAKDLAIEAAANAEIEATIETIKTLAQTDSGSNNSEDIAVLERLGPAGEGIHSLSEYLDTGSLAPKIYTTVRLLMELGADVDE